MNQQQQQQPPQQQPSSSGFDRIKPPKIELKHFGGNRQDWAEFWECFEAAIDKSNLTDAEKFTYLRTLLKGEAKELLAGLATTADNYKVAVDLLKGRCGNKQELIRELHSHLRSLKPCRDLTGLKSLQLQIEKYCRQLKNLSEDIESPQTWMCLEEKLPKATRRELYTLKEKAGAAWNTSELLKELESIVRREVQLAICAHLPNRSNPRENSVQMSAAPRRRNQFQRFRLRPNQEVESAKRMRIVCSVRESITHINVPTIREAKRAVSV